MNEGSEVTNVIRLHETGSPEVLRWESVDLRKPAPGEVKVRHTAIGVDYADVYYRTGVYPVELPAIPGHEAAGVVEELGQGVGDLRVGDRVAYVTPGIGAYAEARIIDATRLVKIPAGLSDQHAAAAILKGMTARYLLRETYPVKAGDAILVHAAAGGVGLMLCQWANHLGANVIGTVSSARKADLARANGCRYTIDYTREDFVERVRQLTEGKRVMVVYDSIGKDTFDRSLDCLAPEGFMVVFGHTSGKVTPFDLMLLAAKGSLYVTRPTLWSRMKSREDLLTRAAEVFSMLERNVLRISVNQTYPLQDAKQAHADLEARRTTGATVLVP